MQANILEQPLFKTITLNKKLTIKSLIYFQFFFVFLYSGICDLTGLPTTISYFIDIINLVLLCYILCDRLKWKKISRYRMNGMVISILILCFMCLFTSFVNKVSPQLVVWAIRNEFRYFPFFIGCVLYLTKYNVKSLINILFKLQILNVIISLIQFFVYGIEQDRLGGVFGTVVGVNAATNAFFCFLMTVAITYYLNYKMSFSKMILTIVSCLLIGAMAELKVLYAEFVIIVIASLILSKKSLKSGIILFVSAVGIIISLMLFQVIFPGWASQMSSISDFINIGFSTGGGYELSRLGAIADINNIWFQGDIIKNLFGYGFGACEYSSFDFFTSDFSRLYLSYHYSWFNFQKDFLETGFAGIVAYAIVIASMFIWITKNKRKYRDTIGLGTVGQIYCVLMVIFFIYNSTLRTETGYMAYMYLAIPFIYFKSMIQENWGSKYEKTNKKYSKEINL